MNFWSALWYDSDFFPYLDCNGNLASLFQVMVTLYVFLKYVFAPWFQFYSSISALGGHNRGKQRLELVFLGFWNAHVNVLVRRRDYSTHPSLWPMRVLRALTSHPLAAVASKFLRPIVYHRLRLWCIFQILNTRAVIAYCIFLYDILSSLFGTQNLCYMESESWKKKLENYFFLPSAYPDLHKSCHIIALTHG